MCGSNFYESDFTLVCLSIIYFRSLGHSKNHFCGTNLESDWSGAQHCLKPLSQTVSQQESSSFYYCKVVEFFCQNMSSTVRMSKSVAIAKCINLVKIFLVL